MRQYGPTVMAGAWRVLNALLEVATMPGEVSVYLKQRDLKDVARFKSDNAMDDVMTCAALHAPEVMEGAALYRNKVHGYRLLHEMDEQGDIVEHVRKVKTVITMSQRLALEVAADNNDPMLQRWARKLEHMVEDELVPYLESLDERLT